MKRVSSCITSIIVFAVGLAIGLVVFGWWLWPVQWENGTLEVVNATQQEDFLRAAIDSYSVNADQNLAINRYNSLGEFGPQTLATIQENPGSQNPQSIQNYSVAVVGGDGTVVVPETPPEAGIDATMRRAVGDPKLATVLFLGGLLILVLIAIFFVARRGRKADEEAKAAEVAATAAVAESPAGDEAPPMEGEPVPATEAEAEAPAEEVVAEGEAGAEGEALAGEELAAAGVVAAAAAVEEETKAAEVDLPDIEPDEEGLGLGGLAALGVAAAGMAAVAGGEEEASAEDAEVAETAVTEAAVEEAEAAPEGKPGADSGEGGVDLAGLAAAGLAGAAVVAAAGTEEAEGVPGEEKSPADEIAEAAGWTVEGGGTEGGLAVAGVAAAGLAAATGEAEPTEAEAEVTAVPDEWQAEPATESSIADEAARLQYGDIIYVEGIGPVYGQKLKEVGIHKPADLLQAGATRKGRDELAEQTGIPHKLILEWVNNVDLFRIKGIGQEYADLLEAAGVDTVPELAQRNPVNLYDKLLEINAQKKLVRKVPVQSQVESWVEQAKSLPRVVTY